MNVCTLHTRRQTLTRFCLHTHTHNYTNNTIKTHNQRKIDKNQFHTFLNDLMNWLLWNVIKFQSTRKAYYVSRRSLSRPCRSSPSRSLLLFASVARIWTVEYVGGIDSKKRKKEKRYCSDAHPQIITVFRAEHEIWKKTQQQNINEIWEWKNEQIGRFLFMASEQIKYIAMNEKQLFIHLLLFSAFGALVQRKQKIAINFTELSH